MGMGFAPTWLRQVSPSMLHMTTLTIGYIVTMNLLTRTSHGRTELVESLYGGGIIMWPS